jgi:predicted metal-binding membrane protein
MRKADLMSGMVMGLGHIGRAMRMPLPSWSFMSMWAVMMVAMMAPTIAPVMLAHRSLRTSDERGFGSTAALVAGYFTVWCLLGVLYFGAFVWFHDLSPSAGDCVGCQPWREASSSSPGATSSHPAKRSAFAPVVVPSRRASVAAAPA